MLGALRECFGEDLGELVHLHAAAMRIQRAWRWYDAHAHRRSPEWGWVLARLLRDRLAHLVRYRNVRRELVREPGSWLSATRADLRVIAHECRDGMWGRPKEVKSDVRD